MGRWAWARGGDCESTSPRSLDELAQLRTHTAHYSPVMNAPLSINSSHADCRPERSFFCPAAARPLEDSTLHRRFACARLSQPCLPGSCPDFSATFTTFAFDDSSLRWLEINT